MYDERTQALIDADRRHLVRAASRLLGPTEAEDAVQDAYVRALEANAPAFNAAQAWLLTVVRNLAIDRLRRNQWMAQWLEEADDTTQQASPSAEMDATLTQEATLALQRLATHLTPADGAVVLLHEVFEMGHAEIAQASGKAEAGSRQQLRRALLRLQQARDAQEPAVLESNEETVFRLYLQSLQLRDPRMLLAMLRQPPIVSIATESFAVQAVRVEALPFDPSTSAGHGKPGANGAHVTCGVVQAGGQLGLVLTLDGVQLCVVPLGVLPERDCETALP